MKKFLFVVVLAFAGLFASASTNTVAPKKSIELTSNMVLAEQGSTTAKKDVWYYLGVYDVYLNGVYIGTYDVYVNA